MNGFSALSGAYLPDALRFRSRSKAFFFFPSLRYAGEALPKRGEEWTSDKNGRPETGRGKKPEKEAVSN